MEGREAVIAFAPDKLLERLDLGGEILRREIVGDAEQLLTELLHARHLCEPCEHLHRLHVLHGSSRAAEDKRVSDYSREHGPCRILIRHYAVSHIKLIDYGVYAAERFGGDEYRHRC